MYFNTKTITETEVLAAIASAIDDLVDGAPGALDTLNELAAALGDDADFSSTVVNALALRARLDQANTFTVGGHIIGAGGISVVPLILRGAAGQTAELFLVQDSNETRRFSVTDAGYTATANFQSDGGVRIGTAVTYTTNQRWLAVQDSASTPSTVSSGVIIYSNNGDIHMKTASGDYVLTGAESTYAPKVEGITADTGIDYTVAKTDLGNLVTLDDPVVVTVTIPADTGTPSLDFEVGSRVDLLQKNTGQVQVVGASGVTVNSATGGGFLRTQWSAATIVKIGANEWVLVGDLA